jgi:predicted transcriptional regulator
MNPYPHSMRAKPEYRDRDDTEVAVLDTLAAHNGDGMTVFSIRAEVGVDIDTLEEALSNLKRDDLIVVRTEGERTRIVVEQHVIGPESNGSDEADFFDGIRRRFGL